MERSLLSLAHRNVSESRNCAARLMEPAGLVRRTPFMPSFVYVARETASGREIRSSVEALAIVNPGLDPVDGRASVVTISLGVAFAQEGATPKTVAKWADDALYDATRGGRNLVFLSNAHAADDACHARGALERRHGQRWRYWARASATRIV